MASKSGKWLSKVKAKLKGDPDAGKPNVNAMSKDNPPPNAPVLPPRVLDGSTGPIARVGVSHDGALIVSVSDDKTVQVWDAMSGKTLQTWSLDCTAIHGLAMSPRETLLAVAADNFVKVWDVDKVTSTNSKPIKTHTLYGSVDSVAFSPDGSLLACGATEHVYVWYLPGHTLKISAEIVSDSHNVLFSRKDGLMYTSNTGQIIFRDKVQLNWQRMDHGERISCLAISSDHKWVASASMSGRVRIWQPASSSSWKPVQSYELNSATVTSLAFVTHSDALAAGTSSGIWDLGSTSNSKRLAWPITGTSSVVASPVCSCIISGADDGRVRIHSTLPADQVNEKTVRCLHGNHSHFQTMTGAQFVALANTATSSLPASASTPEGGPSTPAVAGPKVERHAPAPQPDASIAQILTSSPSLASQSSPSGVDELISESVLKPLGPRSAAATAVLDPPKDAFSASQSKTTRDPFASASADGTYHPPPETYFNPTTISSTKKASHYISPKASYKEPRKCYMCLGYVEHVPNSTEMCRCRG